jgi:hypothetical protein
MTNNDISLESLIKKANTINNSTTEDKESLLVAASSKVVLGSNRTLTEEKDYTPHITALLAVIMVVSLILILR